MADDMIRFRAGEHLGAWLEGRRERLTMPQQDSASLQARAELALWEGVLSAEAARIRLTLGQARCVADVIGSGEMRPGYGQNMGRVFAACAAAFGLARRGPAPDYSSYGAKHGPEGCDPAKWEQELLDYLASLGPAADRALEDAICRWWRIADIEYGDRQPSAEEAEGDEIERFAAAGLRVTAQ